MVFWPTQGGLSAPAVKADLQDVLPVYLFHFWQESKYISIYLSVRFQSALNNGPLLCVTLLCSDYVVSSDLLEDVCETQ